MSKFISILWLVMALVVTGVLIMQLTQVSGLPSDGLAMIVVPGAVTRILGAVSIAAAYYLAYRAGAGLFSGIFGILHFICAAVAFFYAHKSQSIQLELLAGGGNEFSAVGQNLAISTLFMWMGLVFMAISLIIAALSAGA